LILENLDRADGRQFLWCGGFLDDGSAFGVYSRLDLYRAAEKALAR